jgi:hypothetical protein
MTVTFTPGLENLGAQLLQRRKERQERQGDSVWEAYLRWACVMESVGGRARACGRAGMCATGVRAGGRACARRAGGRVRGGRAGVCVGGQACARAGGRAGARACGRACVRACGRACVSLGMGQKGWGPGRLNCV